MFTAQTALLLIVDIQAKLLPKIPDSQRLAERAAVMIACCRAMGIPIIATEQYPEGIGPTVDELKVLLAGCPVVPKRTFSCCREKSFMAALEKAGRRQIVLAGIETHVCVFQTAADLLDRGYAVQVPADAVGSRAAADREIGLGRMRARGADISSVESAVFELLQTSDRPEFKQVLRLIK